MKRDPNLRLTVVDTIYYQQPGMDPTQVDLGYTRFIQNNEQIYQRVAFVDIEPKKLDRGWIEKASCITIQNKQEVPTRRTPSPEELAELSRHVIEVYYEGASTNDRFLISPGESMRVRPGNLDRLFIRSQHGLTRFAYTVTPE